MPLRAIPLLALLLLSAQADYARDAIALGRTRDDALYDAFSKGYSLAPSDAIESAEIVTEFRRAVMIVRQRAQQGELATTERDVVVAMAPYRGRIGFIVQARLNPMNTYAKPPAYDLYVSTGPATGPIPPEGLTREPVYAIGPPGGPLIGVRLEAMFPRADIAAAQSPSLVVTDDKAAVLWQARIDLSRFR
jgi:hypothetical protein